MNADRPCFFSQQPCRACLLAKPDQVALRVFLAQLRAGLGKHPQKAAGPPGNVGQGPTGVPATDEEQEACSSPVCFARDPDLREGFEDQQ